jgi:hypothetical protein
MFVFEHSFWAFVFASSLCNAFWRSEPAAILSVAKELLSIRSSKPRPLWRAMDDNGKVMNI